MLPASTVPQSGQVLVSHHCCVSSMTYSLHLNLMIRQMVSRGLVYPLRVSRLTYTAPTSLLVSKVFIGCCIISTNNSIHIRRVKHDLCIRFLNEMRHIISRPIDCL